MVAVIITILAILAVAIPSWLPLERAMEELAGRERKDKDTELQHMWSKHFEERSDFLRPLWSISGRSTSASRGAWMRTHSKRVAANLERRLQNKSRRKEKAKGSNGNRNGNT